MAGLELIISLFLGTVVAATGHFAQGFLKVEAAPHSFEPKKKKVSKAEKNAIKAAAKKATAAAAELEEPVVSEKALKKRAKEQAKKEQKRAEKAAAAKAEEEAKKKEAAVVVTGGEKKKKKKKKKAAAKVEEAVAQPEVEKKVEQVVDDDDWSMVPTKKGSKKAVEIAITEPTGAPETSVDFDCDSKMFPRIMGVGGSTIKALQLATGTEIDIPKKGGVRTSIIISGTKAGCLLCKKNLEQLVAKNYCDITHPGNSDSSIEVPANKQGNIIGKGGEYIKLITKETGAKIEMPERGSGSNTVTVIGPADAVEQAIKAIKQLMEKGFSDITHANHTMASITVHRDSLGTLLGARGATIKQLQEETRVKINIPKSSDEFIQCSLVGEASDIINCRIRIEAMLVAPEPKPIPPEWTQENILKNLDVSW